MELSVHQPSAPQFLLLYFVSVLNILHVALNPLPHVSPHFTTVNNLACVNPQTFCAPSLGLSPASTCDSITCCVTGISGASHANSGDTRLFNVHLNVEWQFHEGRSIFVLFTVTSRVDYSEHLVQNL